MSWVRGVMVLMRSARARAGAWGAAALLVGLVLLPGRGMALPEDATAPVAAEGEASAGKLPAAFFDSIFLTLTAGIDVTRGDYGLEDESTLYYVPLGFIVDYERLRFRLTLPLLFSDGPVAVDLNGSTTESESASGLGEIQSSISWLFELPHEAAPFIELGLQVTWPTRTRSALGAGAFVFEPRVDLFKSWGRLTPFASFGRSFYTEALDDRFFASAGLSLELSERVSVGAAYDWFDAASDNGRVASEITPFINVRLSSAWLLGPYAIFGLTEGSPDYGGGLRVSFSP